MVNINLAKDFFSTRKAAKSKSRGDNEDERDSLNQRPQRGQRETELALAFGKEMSLEFGLAAARATSHESQGEGSG